MMLPTRPLGASGLAVGALGLGCMGMSWAYVEQRISESTSIDLIHAALDDGVTLIDTADIYGPHRNERLVGRALSRRADDVVLATKGGLVAQVGHTPAHITTHNDGRPEHLRAACEASLERLGVDHIDLYYLHRVDPAVPVEESWGALAELHRQGKIRHLGVSEATVDQLRAVHAIHPVTAVQSELSLWSRDPIRDVVPWCRDHGAAFVPFSPLGRGFLTGRFASSPPAADDFRSRMPRFQAEALIRNARIVDAVHLVADRHGATAGQVALAWVLHQGDFVIPIPGTTDLGHLEQNLAAVDIELDASDLDALDRVPDPVGGRY